MFNPESSTVVKQAEDAVCRELGGETVLLTPENGTVHVLDEVGSCIWQRCAQAISVSSLAEAVSSEYEVDPPQAEADIKEFLAQLIDLGVIEIVE